MGDRGRIAIVHQTSFEDNPKGEVAAEIIINYLLANPVVSISPSPVTSPSIGEQLTLTLNVTAGKLVAGYQVTVQFDPTVLRYVASSNGDYLPTLSAFFVPPDCQWKSCEACSLLRLRVLAMGMARWQRLLSRLSHQRHRP